MKELIIEHGGKLLLFLFGSGGLIWGGMRHNKRMNRAKLKSVEAIAELDELKVQNTTTEVFQRTIDVLTGMLKNLQEQMDMISKRLEKERKRSDECDKRYRQLQREMNDKKREILQLKEEIRKLKNRP